MEKEPETIEVEVVEIDGIAPVPAQPPPQEEETFRSQADWRQWQGKVRQLDMRWWPLWVLLGIILVALILTVGVVFGILFLIYRIIRGFFAAVGSMFSR